MCVRTRTSQMPRTGPVKQETKEKTAALCSDGRKNTPIWAEKQSQPRKTRSQTPPPLTPARTPQHCHARQSAGLPWNTPTRPFWTRAICAFGPSSPGPTVPPPPSSGLHSAPNLWAGDLLRYHRYCRSEMQGDLRLHAWPAPSGLVHAPMHMCSEYHVAALTRPPVASGN